jgi:L,D-transpeptidase catalytic domain/Putative peptidoglycan binding domain
MRRAFALSAGAVALFCAAPAWGANVTLTSDHRVARYEDHVRFRGNLAVPTSTQVTLLRDGAVVAATTANGGAFVFDVLARVPGTYVARTTIGDSGPVAVRIMPRLTSRLVGTRRLGRRIVVAGRLLPARSGRLTLRFRKRQVSVRVGSAGRYRVRVPSSWGAVVTGRIALKPSKGYVTAWRRVRLRLAMPNLQLGSHGLAVLALKQRLHQLHYALPSVDAGYGYATYEAVLAFQKVNWMARTGRADGAFWRQLWSASVPRARVPSGDYIQVDKGRQVLFEVRKGEVVNVLHVSTGATGNTPVGTWHVYRESYGWDWVLLDPMYFLRGFAIHGYPSVPAYPASHGCVRIPIWAARGLRERWGRGTTIRVYA